MCVDFVEFFVAVVIVVLYLHVFIFKHPKLNDFYFLNKVSNFSFFANRFLSEAISLRHLLLLFVCLFPDMVIQILRVFVKCEMDAQDGNFLFNKLFAMIFRLNL